MRRPAIAHAATHVDLGPNSRRRGCAVELWGLRVSVSSLRYFQRPAIKTHHPWHILAQPPGVCLGRINLNLGGRVAAAEIHTLVSTVTPPSLFSLRAKLLAAQSGKGVNLVLVHHNRSVIAPIGSLSPGVNGLVRSRRRVERQRVTVVRGLQLAVTKEVNCAVDDLGRYLRQRQW